MAQFKGDVQFTSSLVFEARKPLDARQVVDLKSDLTSEVFATYLYKGLPVAVVNDSAENNGIYILTADDSKVESNWSKLCTTAAAEAGQLVLVAGALSLIHI